MSAAKPYDDACCAVSTSQRCCEKETRGCITVHANPINARPRNVHAINLWNAIGFPQQTPAKVLSGAMYEIDRLEAALDAERARVTKLEKFAAEVDRIRNNIIGKQGVNWSRDIYPLVAALGEAGYEGVGYDEAREAIKQQIAAEEAERAKVDALVRALLTLEWRYHHPHSDSCTYCGAVRYTLPRIANDKRHASDCAVDAALTLAGYPDQASRDAKRDAK